MVINVACSSIRSHHCQPSAFLYNLTVAVDVHVYGFAGAHSGAAAEGVNDDDGDDGNDDVDGDNEFGV